MTHGRRSLLIASTCGVLQLVVMSFASQDDKWCDASSDRYYHPDMDPMRCLPAPGSLRARRVIVEVGVHTQATYFTELQEDESLIVIGVEPNPAAGKQHPTHSRFFLLPAALANVPTPLSTDVHASHAVARFGSP